MPPAFWLVIALWGGVLVISFLRATSRPMPGEKERGEG